eukprot:3931597-Rhodomonas_salina.1
MCGTESVWCYAMCGNDRAYGATRCAVLSWRMVLPVGSAPSKVILYLVRAWCNLPTRLMHTMCSSSEYVSTHAVWYQGGHMSCEYSRPVVPGWSVLTPCGTRVVTRVCEYSAFMLKHAEWRAKQELHSNGRIPRP